MESSERPGPVEREKELAVLRRQVRRAAKRGEKAEFDRLSAEYGRLKAEHVLKVHEEYVAERRAARAALRAQERAERPGPWRLPSGFASPLAEQRARGGWRPRVESSAPAGGLRPWRGGHPMSERVWSPPS